MKGIWPLFLIVFTPWFPEIELNQAETFRDVGDSVNIKHSKNSTIVQDLTVWRMFKVRTFEKIHSSLQKSSFYTLIRGYWDTTPPE